MCLQTTDYTLYTAQKDMTVYKVMYENTPGQFTSTHRSTTYTKGVLYKDDIDSFEANLASEVVDISLNNVINRRRTYRIDRGIHVYTNLRAATKTLTMRGNRVVLKCIIPKGSKYIKGWDNNEEDVETFITNQIFISGVVGRYTKVEGECVAYRPDVQTETLKENLNNWDRVLTNINFI